MFIAKLFIAKLFVAKLIVAKMNARVRASVAGRDYLGHGSPLGRPLTDGCNPIGFPSAPGAAETAGS